MATWVDVSRTPGAPYATTDEDGWSFTQYGNLVMAANGTDNIQAWTIASSTEYADLAGSPPIGAYLATVRDFVFIGRLANARNKVQWSSIDDPEAWTIGTNQCDEQVIPEGGEITGIVGGEYGTVFSENQVNRFTYTGDGAIFQRDTISTQRGTPCRGSIASYQRNIFFVAYDGFWMLAGGSQEIPIGDQKIDRFFWNDLNQAYLHRVTATVDPLNKLYVVGYPSFSSMDGTPDKMLIFNWTIGRWSKADFSLQYLYSATTQQGYNIDTIDSLYGDLDSIPISLDSPLLTGSGKLSLAAFDNANKLAFFNGANLPALIETTEGQIYPGHRALITEVRPIIDGGTPSIQIGTRNRPNDSIVWGSVVAQNANGFCPVRSDARFHRARLLTQAGDVWQHCSGADPTAQQSGSY